MYRTLNEKSYWLIEMDIGKTLLTSADFSRESSFTLSLNYAELCKKRSSKQVTDNFQRRALLRKIVETL